MSIDSNLKKGDYCNKNCPYFHRTLFSSLRCSYGNIYTQKGNPCLYEESKLVLSLNEDFKFLTDNKEPLNKANLSE